ncbi:MAG: superoxide dismutase family protein, partial [Myxococcota bacterium]
APPAAEPAPAPAPAPEKKAVAKLEARSGSTVTGTVTLTEAGDAVKVRIELAGATPGDHAVHVHEKGDCSAPDGSSAGSHFNPGGHAHGAPDAGEHHPGDFGNVTVGPDGTGTKELETSAFKLAGEGVVVSGLAIIVHEKPDDFSQPTGNAGGRQACGIIAM